MVVSFAVRNRFGVADYIISIEILIESVINAIRIAFNQVDTALLRRELTERGAVLEL